MNKKKLVEIKSNFEKLYPQLGNLRKIKLLSHNNINSTNYLLYSTKGKFVLRYFTDGSKPEKVEKLCRILNYCSQKKIKVMKPIKNIKNKYVDKKNNFYLTYHYKGKLYNGNVKQLKETAKQLGILHKTLQHNPIKYNFRLKQKYYGILNQEELKKLLKLFLNKKNKTLLDKKIIKNYNFLKESMLEHQKNYSSINNLKLKHQLIHHDFHPGNLIFNKNKILSIIDFNSMRKGAVVKDLAFASFRFSLNEKNSVEKMIKKMKIFLDTYLLYNEIEKKQTENFNYFITLQFLEGLSYILRKNQFRNSEYLLTDYEEYVQFLKLAKKINQRTINWTN